MAEWKKEESPTSHDYGSAMAKEFLLIEYGQMGRSLLIYQIVGKIINVSTIMWEAYLRHAAVPVTPIVLLAIVYATFWITETEILRKRRQLMSKAIAEIAYMEDQEWGTLYIRTYQNRYEGRPNAIWAFLMRAEPVIWVALSIAVLFWPSSAFRPAY